MESREVIVGLEEYVDLRRKAERLDNLRKLIWEGTRISSDNEWLYLGDDSKVMDYLKVIEPLEYAVKMEKLKKAKSFEEKEGVSEECKK